MLTLHNHSAMLAARHHHHRTLEQYFDEIGRLFCPVFASQLRHAFQKLETRQDATEIVITKVNGTLRCICRDLIDNVER